MKVLQHEVLRWFVAVVEDDTVVSVTPWDDWVKIPILHRPDDSFVVSGTDELNAFMRASRGERFGF